MFFTLRKKRDHFKNVHLKFFWGSQNGSFHMALLKKKKKTTYLLDRLVLLPLIIVFNISISPPTYIWGSTLSKGTNLYFLPL